MKTFDVQSIEVGPEFDKAFSYIAEPRNLPQWTNAFFSISNGKAILATPAGKVQVDLEVQASKSQGTIDWIMTFPDQTVETAYSRLVRGRDGNCIFSFVLIAPKVPLEELEGSLEQQSAILRRELDTLQHILTKA